MKVKRPWLVAPRTVEYREEEIHLTPDTVLVRHVCTAPSQGTAIHRYRGEEVGLARFNREESGGPFPYAWLQGFAYGVGRVQEVGSAVQGVEAGQLVYSQRLTAEYSVLNPRDFIPLPEGLDAESAALLYQATVGLKGARAADLILGDTVLVTGQGSIGNFAAQLCRIGGAYRVFVTDLNDLILEAARKTGVDLALNPGSDSVVDRIEAETLGRGADVVVESSGSPKAFLQCCEAVAAGGRIVVIGWILDACQFNMSDAFTPKGLEMVVCHSGQSGNLRLGQRRLRSKGMRGKGVRSTWKTSLSDDFFYLMKLMVEGKLKARELISHRFPLKDLVQKWGEFIDTKPDAYSQVLFVSDGE